MEKVIGQMQAKDYYKWRFYLGQYQLKDKEAKVVEQQGQLQYKDHEILKLRMALFQNQVATAKGLALQAKEEYNTILNQLEQELGVTIKDNLVDEVSFEIKQIEDSKE